MTNLRVAVMASIAGILIIAGCANKVDVGHEQTLLLDQDKEWSKAIAGADMGKILGYWTDDAVIYPAQGHPIRGKDEIQNFIEENRVKWGLDLKTVPQEALVFESGDVGYTVGTYDFYGTDAKGDSVDFPGRYLSIWQKMPNDGWKCVLEFNSPTTEPMEQLMKEHMGEY